MARKLRLQFPGAIYHVTFRGNAGQAIFKDDRDRMRLTERVAESATDFGVRVYLYCWMSNHGHLLVETPSANLSRFMSSVLTGYTVYYNQRHGRSGHLMQGRFKSPLVSGDAYLLKLSRYIHLNPVSVKRWRVRSVRARAKELAEYKWSSYRGYVGLGLAEPWVCHAPILAMIPGGGGAAGYREYVEAGLRDPDGGFVRQVAGAALALGPAAFCQRMQREHERLAGRRAKREDVSLRQVRDWELAEKVLHEVCAGLGVAIADVRRRRRDGTARGIVALALLRRCGLSERTIAEELGVGSGAAVSYLIRRAKARAATESAVQTVLKRFAMPKA